jgi:phospholipid/cholesterol/gamma-HCH transport system substrate-binding protein
MKILDRRTTGDLVRLVIFVVVTTLATGLLVITIGNVTFGSSKDYKAVFTDATDLNSGDDVRIAGVKVGSVKSIQIVNRTQALVTFSVASDQTLDQATHIAIRYRNIVGQRYLAVSDELGHGDVLTSGQTIPVSQTSPALDLSVLFNGFKPLFQALTPSDINQLSYEIIQVFQGEGGSLNSLLSHTASLTSTLADRDQVIDELIDNLNQVLAHIGQRDGQLSQLITTLRTFVHGLAQDKGKILGSLDQISDLSGQLTGLVGQIQSPLLQDVKQLRTFAGDVNADRGQLDQELQIEPIKLAKIGSTASYGSWFNFYLCGFHGRVMLPGNVTLPVDYNVGSARCNLG